MNKVREYIPSYVNLVRETAFIEKIKVAAYARVSSDKDEQEDSFDRQVSYYTRFIKANDEWKFAEIYADPGITGTRADKRQEFQRMLGDCRKGLINKILYKSIARFARNTVDALEYIRELKEMGIGVYFETHKIDTLTPGGDVLLTILAAMAEEESRSISKNVKWAYQKKFQQGDFIVNYNKFMGYTRDENHNLVIVPEEAKIVKRIFREFLYGYGYAAIARHLEDDNIRTCTNKEKWCPTVIQRMLKNEKYIGTAIMGKTYKIDVLSKKRTKNDGKQSPMYILEDCIPPIIDKETFELVQHEMKRRSTIRGYSETNEGKYSSKYAFSKKIVCGECGNLYRRHAQTYKGKYQPTWVYAEHKLNPKVCKQLFITEEYLEKAFVQLLNNLAEDMQEIKNNLMGKLSNLINDEKLNRLNEISKELELHQKEMLELYKKKNNGLITLQEYSSSATKIATSIDSLTKEKDKLESDNNSVKMAKSRLKDIEEYIKSLKLGEKFNSEIFSNLVEQIIVRNRFELEFHFKIGIKKTYKLEKE